MEEQGRQADPEGVREGGEDRQRRKIATSARICCTRETARKLVALALLLSAQSALLQESPASAEPVTMARSRISGRRPRDSAERAGVKEAEEWAEEEDEATLPLPLPLLLLLRLRLLTRPEAAA